MIISAYDMEMLTTRAKRGSPDNHGWCFGRPRGIVSAQWPLDRRTGHSMRHTFTLLLPPEYRVHRADLVALSFFGTDWSGDSPEEVPEVTSFFANLPGAAPTDAGLLPLWTYTQSRHPHEHRAILGMQSHRGLDC